VIAPLSARIPYPSALPLVQAWCIYTDSPDDKPELIAMLLPRDNSEKVSNVETGTPVGLFRFLFTSRDFLQPVFNSNNPEVNNIKSFLFSIITGIFVIN
jgi:hypothetical protein